MIKNVKIGDRVRWESAEGTIRGEIKSIDLDRNAAGDLVPWLIISYIRNNREVATLMCGLESNLKMMKFVVTFRDKEAA